MRGQLALERGLDHEARQLREQPTLPIDRDALTLRALTRRTTSARSTTNGGVCGPSSDGVSSCSSTGFNTGLTCGFIVLLLYWSYTVQRTNPNASFRSV